MNASRYARASDVVWRAGPDRVLLRWVGDQSGTGSVELFGPAALVWLALDEPGTAADLAARFVDADIAADPVDGLGLLRERHLIVETTAGA